jgi:hypothetical protein
MPEAVCQECSQFLKKLDKFSEKCLRADKMFTDIVLQNIQLLENEIPNFRYNYGLEDEIKIKPLVSLVTNNENPTAILRVDQSTDTADLLVLLKVEDQMEASPRTKRKKSISIILFTVGTIYIDFFCFCFQDKPKRKSS